MQVLAKPTAEIADNPDVLRCVTSQDCNLAIWSRAPLVGVEELFGASLKDVRFTAAVADMAERLPREMAQSGFPASHIAEQVVEDALHLIDRFANLFDLDRVNVRVACVTTDSCRKFHADYVEARLITTYAGTGTQWIDSEDSDRLSRGEDPRHVQELNAGDVGIFKGKLATDHPAIHRSPPIAGTGEKRLLLVLKSAQRRLRLALC